MSRPNEPVRPEPLAYLLTWTTYGTWLPGDDRGWTRRGDGIQPWDKALHDAAEQVMSADACILDPEQRAIVETTIADHCGIRRWTLFAVNCRSNHVHVIVGGSAPPKLMCEQFKAWCTRRLKEAGASDRTKWWSERGSGRFLNDEASLEAAIAYVRDGQDRPKK